MSSENIKLDYGKIKEKIQDLRNTDAAHFADVASKLASENEQLENASGQFKNELDATIKNEAEIHKGLENVTNAFANSIEAVAQTFRSSDQSMSYKMETGKKVTSGKNKK